MVEKKESKNNMEIHIDETGFTIGDWDYLYIPLDEPENEPKIEWEVIL